MDDWPIGHQNTSIGRDGSDEQESSEVDGALPDIVETGDPERPHGCSLCRFELLLWINIPVYPKLKKLCSSPKNITLFHKT